MIGLLIIIAFTVSNISSTRMTEINYFWEVFLNEKIIGYLSMVVNRIPLYGGK